MHHLYLFFKLATIPSKAVELLIYNHNKMDSTGHSQYGQVLRPTHKVKKSFLTNKGISSQLI